MASGVLERLRALAGDELHGQTTDSDSCAIEVAAARLVEVATWLKHDAALLFDMPIDCTVVDYLGRHASRFAVVWQLYSMSHRHRIRLTVRVPESPAHVASLTPLWPGMNWHEREAWDLYGVHFTGHPQMTRILMYEEFVGHPLRKDYPVDGRQPLIAMRQVREVPTQRRPPPEMLNRP